MKINNYPPMLPTRACKFCFSLQDDAVFADFEIDEHGQAYLLRISFDGYGCCKPLFSSNEGRLSKEKTDIIKEAIASENLDSNEIKKILKDYLTKFKDDLWSDALEEHKLIEKADKKIP